MTRAGERIWSDAERTARERAVGLEPLEPLDETTNESSDLYRRWTEPVGGELREPHTPLKQRLAILAAAAWLVGAFGMLIIATDAHYHRTTIWGQQMTWSIICLALCAPATLAVAALAVGWLRYAIRWVFTGRF